MEKSFRIIYTLLLCLLAVSANAQKNKKDKDEVKKQFETTLDEFTKKLLVGGKNDEQL